MPRLLRMPSAIFAPTSCRWASGTLRGTVRWNRCIADMASGVGSIVQPTNALLRRPGGKAQGHDQIVQLQRRAPARDAADPARGIGKKSFGGPGDHDVAHVRVKEDVLQALQPGQILHGVVGLLAVGDAPTNRRFQSHQRNLADRAAGHQIGGQLHAGGAKPFFSERAPRSSKVLTVSTPSASTATPKVGNCTVVAWPNAGEAKRLAIAAPTLSCRNCRQRMGPRVRLLRHALQQRPHWRLNLAVGGLGATIHQPAV